MNCSVAPALSTMRNLGMEPDPWQLDVLCCKDKRVLLNCARQAGKSTTGGRPECSRGRGRVVYPDFARCVVKLEQLPAGLREYITSAAAGGSMAAGLAGLTSV